MKTGMKRELINIHGKVREILDRNRGIEPSNEEINFLNEAKNLGFKPIDDLFTKDYDRRVLHPGFGAPDCCCHIAPPCQNCVDFTNAMTEEELERHLSLKK